MRKRESYSSFRDIDADRFHRVDGGNPPSKPGKTALQHAGTVNDGPQNPAVEDEAALFLAAVAGDVDVSLKHSRDVLAAHPAEPGRKKSAGPLPEPEKPPVSKQPPPDETRLFANAMDGVRPIRAKGRDLAPPTRVPSPTMNNAMMDMDVVFNGKLEFSLEYTDEFVQGYVRDLDPIVFGKLKAGAYSPEAHVDLHGQNMEQAYATLTAFIKHAYQSGKRHLLVVTGRGKNSPGGTSVLRERVQAWFTRDPFKRVVLGFCSAKPGDGGAGALYLLLRKRRKNQGKIVWDTKPTEEELLL